MNSGWRNECLPFAQSGIRVHMQIVTQYQFIVVNGDDGNLDGNIKLWIDR